jgi:hypothetical protein
LTLAAAIVYAENGLKGASRTENTDPNNLQWQSAVPDTQGDSILKWVCTHTASTASQAGATPTPAPAAPVTTSDPQLERMYAGMKSAIAGGWTLAAFNDRMLAAINAKEMSKANGRLLAWTHWEYADSQQGWDNVPLYLSSYDQIEVDCPGQRSRTLSIVIHPSNGEAGAAASRDDPKPEWRSWPPNSLGKGVIESICKLPIAKLAVRPKASPKGDTPESTKL